MLYEPSWTSSLTPTRVTPRPAGSLAPSAAATGRDLIRQVQQRLQAGGYTPGTVDGALGLQTRQALRGFQKAKGLRPTGEPDTATLDALDSGRHTLHPSLTLS